MRVKLFLTFLFSSIFTIAHTQQVFQNVTTSMGIAGQTGLGHAVGWGDIDNDGDPDLGMSNQEGDGFWFYRNDGTVFTNITASAGLGGLSANKTIICELTGDDYNDLLIRTRTGTQKLFKSNGDGTFEDISSVSSVASSAIYNIADFNNDGLIDLLSVAGSNYSILYNNGDATFSSPEIIAPLPDFMGVAVFDYNNDGLIDIYGTTYGENPNQLLKNNGDGTFTDQTVEAGLVYTDRAHGIDVGDYNNDGFVDVYLGSYSNSGGGCKLFKNNGDSTFTDVTSSTNTTGHNDTRTTVFIDYNNDGWLDIFSSHHDFYVYSNSMQKSLLSVDFEETANELGIAGEFVGDYFGQAWADYNLDGFIDFFAAGHVDKYRLFKNTDCPGNAISIKLKGVDSNPNGLGARIEYTVGSYVYNRFMLPNGGQHDFSELKLLLGIGEATYVDNIKIYWPSGIVQSIGNTLAGENLLIVEDESANETNEHKSNTSYVKMGPNPTKDLLNFRFNAKNTTEINISLNNLKGQTLETFYEGRIEKGIFSQTLNLNHLNSGIYLLKITRNSYSEFYKIIKN